MGKTLKYKSTDPHFLVNPGMVDRIYRVFWKNRARVLSRFEAREMETVNVEKTWREIPFPILEQTWTSWNKPGVWVRVIRIKRDVWDNLHIQVVASQGGRLWWTWDKFVCEFVPPCKTRVIWDRLLGEDFAYE